MHLEAFLAQRLKEKGHLFVPYLALGDPDFDRSFELVKALLEAGADTIELGLPFTDPTADGPVLQRAFQRILKKDFHFDQVIEFLKRLKAEFPEQPFILMGYGNIFLQRSFRESFQTLSELNVGGIITADIPYEEKKKLIKKFDLEDVLKKICWIDFVTPTTDAKRLKKICKNARGFIYVVSYKGITGQANFYLKPIEGLFARIRDITDVPLLVGFGIREVGHATQAIQYADGFIVGSKIHQIIENNPAEQIAESLKKEMLQLQPTSA